MSRRASRISEYTKSNSLRSFSGEEGGSEADDDDSGGGGSAADDDRDNDDEECASGGVFVGDASAVLNIG